MQTVWDIVYLRRPVLNYVCPGICEVIFSGSSNPVIILSEPAIGQVTGLALGGFGGFQLTWNAFPGALCYNVYFIGGDNVAVLLAQCITDPTFELPPGLDPGVIVVTPVTLEGEGPPSDPIVVGGGGGGGFWDLTWVVDGEEIGNPPGTISKTLEPASFSVTVTQPARTSFMEDPVSVGYDGSMMYTGVARDCNLHLVVSGLNFPIFTVRIAHNGDDLAVISTEPVGTYDIPFTVPASVNALIEVRVASVGKPPNTGPTNQTLDGTLQVTPL